MKFNVLSNEQKGYCIFAKRPAKINHMTIIFRKNIVKNIIIPIKPIDKVGKSAYNITSVEDTQPDTFFTSKHRKGKTILSIFNFERSKQNENI